LICLEFFVAGVIVGLATAYAWLCWMTRDGDGGNE
jgi:hypothetical protein